MTTWDGPVKIYAIVVALLLPGMWAISKVSARSFARRYPKVDVMVCRWLLYPRWIRRYRFLQPWTAIDCLLLITYLTSNAIVLAWHWPSTEDLERRFGALAVVNLALLFLGPTHDLPSTVLGLSLRNYGRMHRVIAILGTGLALAHAALAWNTAKQSKSSSVWPWSWVVRQVSTSGAPYRAKLTVDLQTILPILFIILVALAPVRNRLYEIFLGTHRILALACLVGLWFHVPSHSGVSRSALYLASSIFAVTLLLLSCYVVWLNLLIFTPGRFRAEGVAALHEPRSVKISWKNWPGFEFGLGQYLRLASGTSIFDILLFFTGILPGHPFMAIPDDRDGRVDVLGEMRPFISSLWQGTVERSVDTGHASDRGSDLDKSMERRPLALLLSGPYGGCVSFGGFEHVLMVAGPDCRISSFLPYLRRTTQRSRGRLRVLTLVWEARSGEEVDMWKVTFNRFQETVKSRGLPVVRVAIYYPEDWPSVASFRKGEKKVTKTNTWHPIVGPRPDAKTILTGCGVRKFTDHRHGGDPPPAIAKDTKIPSWCVRKEDDQWLLVVVSGEPTDKSDEWHVSVQSSLSEHVRLMSMPDWT